jgi:hypothetical protein
MKDSENVFLLQDTSLRFSKFMTVQKEYAGYAYQDKLFYILKQCAPPPSDLTRTGQLICCRATWDTLDKHLTYFYVLLTLHHSVSAWWNQCDAIFIQFIENQGPLHVSSITCSSSGGTTKAAFSILRAYNVSWLWDGWSFTDIIRTNYTKCRLCSASGGWTNYARNM